MTDVLDRLIVQRAAHLFGKGTPEKRLVEDIRAALQRYDRETKLDGRRHNGTKVITDAQRTEALRAHLQGDSIREAAKRAGVSYGTVWRELQRRGFTKRRLPTGR